jgi:hypothetical protein
MEQPCKEAMVARVSLGDEDITVSDMTTIACFYYKVN